MYLLLCFTLFAICFEGCSSDNSGIGPNCPSSLVDSGFFNDPVAVYKGKCYMFVARPKLTWQQAGASCRRYHHTGRLVTIPDEDTQMWLMKVMEERLMWRRHRVWIGLNDQRLDHTFEWQDGTRLGSYTYWTVGAPGAFFHLISDCIYMAGRKEFRWKESRCDDFVFNNYPYICEFAGTGTTAPPPTTTSTTTMSTTPSTTPTTTTTTTTTSTTTTTTTTTTTPSTTSTTSTTTSSTNATPVPTSTTIE